MKNGTIEWNFYEPDADADVSRRFLPHIDICGAITFVTFRLADSMPSEIVKQWHDEMDQWLSEHGLLGRDVESILACSHVDPQLKRDLKSFKHRRWHQHLDDCHGGCELQQPEIRQHAADSLLHFDQQPYDIERFVIMPNHIHVLIQMRRGYSLRKQFREIQRFSARQINRVLGRSGEFWQGEPFDHVVRNPVQFDYLRTYIVDNPLKVKLRESEFTLWIRS
jgi:putative transposase